MKKIMISFFIFLSIFVFTGCSNKNLYHAKVINDNYEFNEDFVMNNRTLGALYKRDGHYIKAENVPKERMIIINNENDFKYAFKKFEEIDMNKEMIVMHAFTTAGNSEYEVVNIKISEKKLIVEYTDKKNRLEEPNASQPDTKWVIVKMDKLDVDCVDFVYLISKNY